MENIQEWAAYHHERLDGNGYPFHLQGAELSLGSRVMAVADVFTAITEDRPYRAGMSPEEASRLLVDMAKSGALDSDVVQLLLDNFTDVNHLRVLVQTASREEYQAFRTGL